MSAREVRRGKKAEGRIAAALSRITGLKFARSVGSGSGHTWRVFAGQQVRGDIVCVDDPTFEFTIESKKTTPKKFQLDLLLTKSPSASFVKWWQKVSEDAMMDEKLPILVINGRTNGPMMCFIRKHDLEECGVMLSITNTMTFYYVPPDKDGSIHANETLKVTTVEQFAEAYKVYHSQRGSHGKETQ